MRDGVPGWRPGGYVRKSTEYLLYEVIREREQTAWPRQAAPRDYFGALTREKMATRTMAVNSEAITLTELKSVRYAMTSANR